MDARLTELESKFSYQEHLLEQLNEVVTEQRFEIDRLNKKVELLKRSLHDSQSNIKDAKDETTPPHY